MITIDDSKDFRSLGQFASLFPFQTKWYLETFFKRFGKANIPLILEIKDDDRLIGCAAFEIIDGNVYFIGMEKILNGQEVTDYGDIVVDKSYADRYKEIWDAIIQWLKHDQIQKLYLDYIREDSPTYHMFKVNLEEKTIAPFVSLPMTFDTYIDSLERTDRKELRRKIRRLETVPYTFSKYENPTRKEFDQFVNLHRLSSPSKETFMSEEMEEFFWDLTRTEKENWKTCIYSLSIEGNTVASMYTFENESAVFGYNSGYDPKHNYYSVGLLLHAFTIKYAIEHNKKIYDFMRGGERYKYDLGAHPLRLYSGVLLL